jgi:hypothetical protein
MEKRFPTDDATLFFICESVRQEAHGKVSLLGLFTAGEILVPVGTPMPLILASLAFLIVFKDGEGQFSLTMSLFNPSEQPIVRQAKMPEIYKEPGKAHNVMINFAPFQTPELGRFRVVVELDDRKYERTFLIREDATIH